MTRQLLRFSQAEVFEPRVIDLNDVLADMEKMLGRMVGEDVEIARTACSSATVRADRGSIEQVVMNLAVNARDAMPLGGKLTIETANVFLDDEYARGHAGVTPGAYVMLALVDTGAGIDEATLPHIFEPFFTTKEKDKGTGLGLSIVFGIVRQSGGSVEVHSELGKGTTFKVYLPHVEANLDAEHPSSAPAALRGSETILVVEDDEQVRAIARGILARNGYDVIEARDAGEARRILETHQGAIHLLLSDVVMPQMSGPELARQLTSARPEMKVLCMSGYADDNIARHGFSAGQFALIQKPITPGALARKVREVLDEGAPVRSTQMTAQANR